MNDHITSSTVCSETPNFDMVVVWIATETLWFDVRSSEILKMPHGTMFRIKDRELIGGATLALEGLVKVVQDSQMGQDDIISSIFKKFKLLFMQIPDRIPDPRYIVTYIGCHFGSH